MVSHEAECGSAGEIFRFGFLGKVEGQDLRRLALLQQERGVRGFSVSRLRYRASSIRRCRGPSNHRDDCCNHSDQVRTGKTLQLPLKTRKRGTKEFSEDNKNGVYSNFRPCFDRTGLV